MVDGDEGGGRPGTLLHDLRRSAVRNLAPPGVSRSVAMKITGHKTEAIFRRYAISSTSDLREAGAKLAQLGDSSAFFSYSRRCRVVEVSEKWWAGAGLNRRHQDFQSCALPTELPAHQGCLG